MSVLVGIDGGGSGTRAVVARVEGERVDVLGRGTSGPSNPYVSGPQNAAAECESAVVSALEAATRLEPNLSRQNIAAFGFGLAGVRRAQDAASLRPHLGHIVGRAPFALETDAVAAHSGAFKGMAGVALLAGTGAIAVSRDDDGATCYADGWGPLLGDEGGGYWIGLEALRAVCRAQDGRGPKTRLDAALFSALDVRDADEIVLKIYRDGFNRETLAKLSRVVFDAASNGSSVANEICGRAGESLANCAIASARSLLSARREKSLRGEDAPPVELPIALCGGLFEDDNFRASVGYRIGERMIEMKRDFLPLAGWRIVRPHFDAAIGAALLARKTLA